MLGARKRRLGRTPAPAPSAQYSIDFTVASIEDPLSAGGIWTNNTQGTGGNDVMGSLASMRVALAVDGATKIAQHAVAAVEGYEDSFAFVPGISASGNIRITAVVYRDPAYAPSENHELELILGCAIPSGGSHRWIECLWNSAGNQDIVNLDGPPDGFTSIGSNVNDIDGPVDGDVWVAELDRSDTPNVKWWVNGVLACQSSSGLITGLGSGAGIAAFRRSGGGTASNRMGFRSFLAEAF